MATSSTLGRLFAAELHVVRPGIRWSAFILVAACFAYSGGTTAFAQAASSLRLQPLVNDAVAQLEIAYRHDRAELERRYHIVGQAISEWNKSSRDAANNQRLAGWLRAVMQASMPGSHEPLPPIPEFESARVELETLTQPTTPAVAPDAAPASVTESPMADAADVPTTAPAPTHVEPAETSAAQAVEVHKPVAADEGDPFRDDPLPDEGGMPNEGALPSGH